eukprot:1321886-Amorphochlora_amoeboformis.AAC.1
MVEILGAPFEGYGGTLANIETFLRIPRQSLLLRVFRQSAAWREGGRGPAPRRRWASSLGQPHTLSTIIQSCAENVRKLSCVTVHGTVSLVSELRMRDLTSQFQTRMDIFKAAAGGDVGQLVSVLEECPHDINERNW